MNELMRTAADALGRPAEQTELKAASGRWYLFESSEIKKSMFGLVKKKLSHVGVLDREGVVRFKKTNAYHLAF
ncbi:hypothetical protein ACFSQ7_36635 [Paenibacillus rhizoplanae]